MAIYISIGNEKLNKTAKVNKAKVVSFDLPPGQTCPFAGECKEYCYAKKSRFSNMEPKVTHNRENLEASLGETFVKEMVETVGEICAHTRRPVYIRLHASGDFYSPEYAQKWADIARMCPNVTFYGYTKSVAIVNGTKWPSNVRIAFSYGGKQDLLIPEDATVAKVFKTAEEALKAGYDLSVNGDDLAVVRGGKLGLLFH